MLYPVSACYVDASGRRWVVCRDTYPNQHVGITVRVQIYRWIDRDAAGVPQVCCLPDMSLNTTNRSLCNRSDEFCLCDGARANFQDACVQQ